MNGRQGKKNQENQNANLKPSSFFRPFGIILIVMDGDEIEKLKGKKKKRGNVNKESRGV